MKKAKLLLFLVMILAVASMVLFACGDKDAHDCKDANSDHKCDVCEKVLSACADENLDHKCDICETSISCFDNDNNHNCDICGKELSYCFDNTSNHKCELCGETISSCKDENRDHSCDICGKVSSCEDKTNDHKCDVCEKELSACADENFDHVCDICKKTISACADATGDHVCEYCSKPITSLCINYNEDHCCDICGHELGDCSDYLLQAKPNENELENILVNGCPICGGSVMLEYNLKDDDTYEISGVNRSIVSLLGYQIIINSTQYNGKEVTSVRENAFDDYDNAVIFNVTTLDIDTDNSSITILNNLKEMLTWSMGEDITPYEILEFDGFGYVEGDAEVFLGYYVGEANKVVLPQKITYLGDNDDLPQNTFWCSKASSIVIHSNVRQIQTFGVFSSITDIYYTGTEEQWNEVARAGWDKGLKDYTIHYNYVIEAHECIDEDAGHFCDICGACVDENKDHYCDVCEKQSSVCADEDNDKFCDICNEYVESSLSFIKNQDNTYSVDSFDGSRTDVIIPSTYSGLPVTSIGSSVFYNCTSLKSVVIPSSVRIIGGWAFYNCSSLTSVVIGDSVISIGEYAFEDCTSLTSIEIPSSVRSIGEYAFEDCTSLTSVNYIGTIESWCGITFGNGYANPFYYAKKLYLNGELLTELVIPSSVTWIGGWAFYNCTSLTSVVIPSSVRSIGYAAFTNCTSLTSVVIPSSVTSIGWAAFKNCTSLTIYCEAESKPSGWDSSWNSSYRPVVWGYSKNA